MVPVDLLGSNKANRRAFERGNQRTGTRVDQISLKALPAHSRREEKTLHISRHYLTKHVVEIAASTLILPIHLRGTLETFWKQFMLLSSGNSLRDFAGHYQYFCDIRCDSIG